MLEAAALVIVIMICLFFGAIILIPVIAVLGIVFSVIVAAGAVVLDYIERLGRK